MRRTKIVCTIGPASRKRGVMESMLHAGMNVARLNFSHGTHEEHAHVIADLRALAQRKGLPIAILQDLCGPKVRLGDFGPNAIALQRGQTVGFAPTAAADVTGQCPILPLPIPALLAVLKPGRLLLLDDGKMQLRVTRVEGEPNSDGRLVWAKCLTNGELKSHKGVAAPGVALDIPAVTDKDKDDLRFGLAQGVDWVAASFIRRAEDLQPLRDIMAATGQTVPLIAKIEKAEAVRGFDSILAAVDGIMVARGDLGVEMSFDEVPIVQKRLIKACNRAGKPVITATQMLESMMQNPRPTRAEAADVANAILDGTDAVMLSGETAAGQFPIEAVRTMARVAIRAEAAFFEAGEYGRRLDAPRDVTGAVACATAEVACQIKASAILCATTSGGTARKVAQYRPNVPILGATTEPETFRRLALTWGVTPVLIGPVRDMEQMMQTTLHAAHEAKLVHDGDRVVLTAGVPVNNPGTTNLLKVHQVGQPL